MIETRALHVVMEGRTLLRDVTLHARPGELVALLGANGVGKTTLLRTLAGLRPANAGDVLVNGRSVASLSHRARALEVAYVLAEDTDIDDILVVDAVRIGRYAFHPWWEWGATPDDDAAVERALQAADVQRFAARRVRSLSTGERQRVWLALALAQESSVLLLDEPTSHLDVRVARAMLQLLRAQTYNGKAIVCAMHDLNEAAAYADRIVLLGDERVLADGPPQAVLADDAVERAYGVAMERVHAADGTLRVFARTR
jgi:iron complex transport system ATP-binding protein